MIFSQLNPGSCKTYLVADPVTKEALIFDPLNAHVNLYLDVLREQELTLKFVVDSHTHADHLSGGGALQKATNCDYAMHADATVNCVTKRLSDGEELHLGTLSLRVLATPGHTPDSICLVLPDRILTGDTLFVDEGGVGRDDLPGGSPEAHWKSLSTLLSQPEHLGVFPGHEYRDQEPSTIKAQKKKNPRLQHTTLEEYIEAHHAHRLPAPEWMSKVIAANQNCADAVVVQKMDSANILLITPEQLQKKIADQTSLLLIDLRESDELATVPLFSNAQHIQYRGFSKHLAELASIHDKQITLICRTGRRARIAAQALGLAGCQRIFVLAGGMDAWAQQNG